MSEVSKKFKVGDKVVRTVECDAGYTIKQWGTYTISKVDEYLYIIFLEGIYNKDGKPDWFNPRNFELVEEEETMSEQTQNTCDVTPKTPYQEKGFTENSLFKFVGEGVEFEQGEILKIHDDDGTYTLAYISTTSEGISYLCFDEVEYIGEEGVEDMLPDYEENLTTKPIKDVVNQDNVNHPNHYRTGKTECIVAMEEMLSTEEFIGYLRGNIYKYTYRYKDKNGVEDLKKAQWYLNKLIEKEQQKETNHG